MGYLYLYLFIPIPRGFPWDSRSDYESHSHGPLCCDVLQRRATGRACEASVTTARTTSWCVDTTACSPCRCPTGYRASCACTPSPTSTCRTPRRAWTSTYRHASSAALTAAVGGATQTRCLHLLHVLLLLHPFNGGHYSRTALHPSAVA